MNKIFVTTLIALSVVSVSASALADQRRSYEQMQAQAKRSEEFARQNSVSAEEYYRRMVTMDRAMWPSDASMAPFVDSAEAEFRSYGAGGKR